MDLEELGHETTVGVDCVGEVKDDSVQVFSFGTIGLRGSEDELEDILEEWNL